MSSPSDRVFDPNDPSPYAPRWVRDPTAAKRSSSHGIDPQSLEDERPRRLGEAPMSRPTRDAPPLAGEPAPDEEPLVIENYRVPHSLDPGFIPEPWPRRARSSRSGRFGLVTKLGLAVGVAALIALFAVGKIPPALNRGADERAGDAGSFGQRFATHAPKAQDRASGALEPASEPAAPVPNPPAPNPPPPTLASASPIGISSAVAAPSPPHTAMIVVPQPAPEPPPVVRGPDPNSDEVMTLVKRGEEFATAGDFAAARLMLRRAAETRNPRAALALAATYDPTVLEKLGVYGVAGDVAMARSWYEKAIEFGSADAARRLELLASKNR